jgi:hypothetical protein
MGSIRAGIVSDPKDYRWSGYGEATAGRPEAQAGLRWLAEHPNADGLAPAWTADSPIAVALAWYREQLYGKGEEVRNAEGAVIKRGFTEAEIQEEIKAGGWLPLVAFLRLRVRYFTDGAILGSQAFVESVFQAHRQRFSEKRQSGFAGWT